MEGQVPQQAWGWRSLAMPGRVACALWRSLVACLPQLGAWAVAVLLLHAILSIPVPVSAAAAAHTLQSPSATLDFPFAEPFFEAVGDNETIPTGIVTALAQDGRGWLWIGTQRGLIRYDGYRFHLFLHRKQDAASLGGDFITSLYAARDGRLWVGTESDGVSVFDPGSERFVHFRHDPRQADSLGAGVVWALAGDADGWVWIGTDQGLAYCTPGCKRLRRHRHDARNSASLANDQVRSLLFDRSGRLWVGSADGLQRRVAGGSDGAGGFERIASDAHDPESLAKQEIRSLFQARDGKLWLGTRKQGAAWLDIGERPGPLHRLAVDTARGDRLSHGWIGKIAQPRPDQIWLGSYGGGMNVVDASDGRVLQHLRHDPALASSLALDTIGAMLVDRSGLLWVGSWGGGLQRINVQNVAVRMLRHSPERKNGLSHADVRSILPLLDGRILVGTAGNGIDILDRQQGVAGGYRPTSAGGRGQTAGGPGLPGLPDASVLSLAQTRDGAIWAGTQQAGVQRLLPASSQWQSFGVAQGLPDVLVRRLLASSDGGMWAGTSLGPAFLPTASARFEVLNAVDGHPVQSYVTALAEDAKGRVWIGTVAGLWLHEPGAKALLGFRHEPGRADSLVSDTVIGLLVDRRQQLWVATAQGLERLQSRDGALARFEHVQAKVRQSGLRGDVVASNLLEDRQGRIWSESWLLEPDSMQMTLLSKAEGVDLGTTWLGSFAASNDGLFMFGGTLGLALIDPQRFVAWQDQPPLRATELSLNGVRQPLGLLEPMLNLSPEHANFAIEFAALDFSAPQKNRYQYRLQGYDKQWVESDGLHRSAGYGNLWPGRYLLQVRGSNRLGQWSSQELAIPILMHAAFWQTAWFATLTVLLLLALLALGFRWRVKRLRSEARRLHKLVAARTRDISTAHDELASAHRHLQETQLQLVQSEKMASLGQLVANVAHEINTPISALKSSGQTIADALQVILARFGEIYRLMNEPERQLFWQMLRHPRKLGLSSREERLQIREAARSLAQHGVKDEVAKATVLVQLHAQQALADYLPLLAHPQVGFILEMASAISLLINNTDNINTAVGRVSRIVFALQSLASMEHGGKLLDASVQEGIEAVLMIYHNQLRHGVELVQEYESLPPLRCFPDQLNQVWINLIQNALQAMCYKGRLEIRVRRQGDAIVVSIADTGCGIPEAIRERIFEPFFTTRAAGEGSGLGLDLVRKVVARHRGTITLHSEVGVGSTFSVTLPLAVDGLERI
jgi:signal transduction histidine kinase/ligand-binding sensor domain-containing protein